MFSRLVIIGFLLMLPIAIALMSQHMARTVAPPKIDNKVIAVSLRPAPGRQPQAAPAAGLPESYRPRSVKSIRPVEEEAVNPPAAASAGEEQK